MFTFLKCEQTLANALLREHLTGVLLPGQPNVQPRHENAKIVGRVHEAQPAGDVRDRLRFFTEQWAASEPLRMSAKRT